MKYFISFHNLYLCLLFFIAATSIEGANIVHGTTVSILPGKRHHFKLLGKGIEIEFPAGAVSEPVTLDSHGSYSGEYELPDNSVLVSGVYWLALNPPVKFAKKITIRIQHCADADSVPFFVTARRSQEILPYKFWPLSGGEFTYPDCGSTTSYGYGCIQVEHFCAVAVAARKKSFFAFRTYYIPSSEPNDYEVHITVTPNLEPCVEVY